MMAWWVWSCTTLQIMIMMINNSIPFSHVVGFVKVLRVPLSMETEYNREVLALGHWVRRFKVDTILDQARFLR